MGKIMHYPHPFFIRYQIPATKDDIPFMPAEKNTKEVAVKEKIVTESHKY